jgi:L-arabinokinase
MDQVAVHCGVENSLVSLVCQPASIGDPVAIPEGLEFWGLDSGVRHAVVGSDYSSVRVGAFMGYRIIADLAGLYAETIRDGIVKIDDDRWNGYLCNITPDEYESEFADRIPNSISGRNFLVRYSGTTDTVAVIEPDKLYSVKAPTEHAIYENYRVNQFADLLTKPTDDATLVEMGELMFASHAGYASCGLNERGTDLIVEMVREKTNEGIFGGRITGGGSGGTVVILSRTGSRPAVEKIAERYTAKTGRTPYIFQGTSPGCSDFGHLRVRYIAN